APRKRWQAKDERCQPHVEERVSQLDRPSRHAGVETFEGGRPPGIGDFVSCGAACGTIGVPIVLNLVPPSPCIEHLDEIAAQPAWNLLGFTEPIDKARANTERRTHPKAPRTNDIGHEGRSRYPPDLI